MGSSALLFTPAVGLALLRVLALLLPVLPLAAAWRQIRNDRAAGQFGLLPFLELVAIASGVLFAPALLRVSGFAGHLHFDDVFAADGPWHLSFRAFMLDRAVPLLWTPLRLAQVLASGQAEPDIARGSLLLGMLALLAVLLPPLASRTRLGLVWGVRNLLLVFWGAYATLYTVALLLWLGNLLNFWSFLVLFFVTLLLRD